MPLHDELEKQGTWLFRYRGILPLIVILTGTLIYLKPGINYSGIYFPEINRNILNLNISLILSLLGLFIRVYTVGHTPVNTSGRNVKNQVAETLNTSGSYSLVRHPLYAGNFFMWLGPVVLTGNSWFIIVFILSFWIYYERIMFAEEQFLRKKFGLSYLDWAERVPAFIPRFKNFKKPGMPFSWKKILKKEKNGLAAVLLIFCLLDISGTALNGDTNYNYTLIALSIVSVLLYFCLKFLKKYTEILNEDGR